MTWLDKAHVSELPQALPPVEDWQLITASFLAGFLACILVLKVLHWWDMRLLNKRAREIVARDRK